MALLLTFNIIPEQDMQSSDHKQEQQWELYLFLLSPFLNYGI